MIKKFKENDTLISFDVNFRANLWSENTAKEVILSILPNIDILFISEETLRRMMRKKGELKDIIKNFCDEHGIKIIASSKRKVVSPTNEKAEENEVVDDAFNVKLHLHLFL